MFEAPIPTPSAERRPISHSRGARRLALIALLPMATVLVGCQTTAGLPTVDDAQRRPINSAAAIELQACKAEASALRATLSETLAPQCARVEPTINIAATLPAKLASAPPVVKPAEEQGASRLAVFVFEQGQVSLVAHENTRQALRTAAEGAELIQVRGRSGAQQESPADILAARRRAEAAVSLLKELGVPTQKLRVSWQGMADEAGTAGQARRVEIEFIDKAPTVLFTKAAADKGGASASKTAPAANGTAAAKSSSSPKS